MTTSGRRGNHEGTRPRQRPDGRWQIDVRYVRDGASRRASVYGKTQAEVRRKAKELRSRLDVGKPARDAKVTLGEFATEWAATTLAASDRKPATKELYARIVRTQIAGSTLGSTPLDKLRPRHIEGWVAGLRSNGLAASTVRTTYTILRAILDTAVRDGAVAENAAHAIRRPKVTAVEAAFLEPAEVHRLLAAASGGRYAALFGLLVNTGLRRGEALALRWSDVDFDASLIRVRGTLGRVNGVLEVTDTKTAKSRRAVPANDAVLTLLRGVKAAQNAERLQAGSQWHQTGYVFTTEFGEPCDPRNALRALKVAADRAGLPSVGLHTLRHSAASMMLSGGVPLKVVSDILGHASVAITGDIYGHVAPDVSREAVAKLSAALMTGQAS